MKVTENHAESNRYAKCVEVSKRIRWDIDRDVIRGRKFDFSRKFLPDGLSLVGKLDFLTESERRLLSQIQGRTYANMFGLVERFIGAKMLEVSRRHALSDQTALEALVRFTDEELKHQQLFRMIEGLTAEEMAPGYRFLAQPNEVAEVVLGKSTWAVLALTCHIEIFTQVHYRQSIERDEHLSELYKDVFFFHWKEESQHAILDELEWQHEHRKLGAEERNKAVDDLIDLVSAVDGILQIQAPLDVEYFLSMCERQLSPEELQCLHEGVLRAYRWQYIASGVQEPRFSDLLGSMITSEQSARINKALAPIVH